MSLTDDFLKGLEKRGVSTTTYTTTKKKKKKEEETVKKTSSVTGSNKLTQDFLASLEKYQEEDIAPVSQRIQSKMTIKDEEIAPTRTWFQKGAFEDGYDFGDISKTILGSITDVGENLGAGILGIGEKTVDALAYLAPAATVANDVQTLGYSFDIDKHNKLKKDTVEFIKKDLYNEEKVAKAIISNPIKALTGIDAEEDSVFGEKSDSVVQSGGQLLGTIGLQAAGVPWFVTSGVTSFGSEAENALNQGATYEQAGVSAAVSATAEMLTEKMFGGSGLGEKGLINVDAATRGIKNKLLKSLLDYGVDMGAEGAEEVVSQVMSNFGSALYREENLKDILASEEAFDEYWESFIGGAALGGVANSSKFVGSAKKGTDYRADFTQNEQKVVDKVYESRLAEAEKNGKLTSRQKSKLYEAVSRDLEKGYFSTDTIEEALGGENYQRYKQAEEWEKSLQDEYDTLSKEYDELYNMKGGDKSSKDADREAFLKGKLPELKKRLDNVKATSTLSQMKEQIGNDVFTMAKEDRLVESYNERARRGQAFEADLTKYDAQTRKTIENAINSGTLNNTNRTHELVDFIAKISADKGVPFDFTNNAKIKDTQFAVEGKIVNGYKTDSGITLNVESPKYLESTVGHEITHVLEGTEFYNTLQETIFKYAESKGEYKSRLDALTKLYEGVKDADVKAELTADLVGDYIFADKDFVNKLSTENRNVFQKVYDEIKYLCKVATAGSKEARELEKVKKVFEDAYRANVKETGKTQHSISDKNIKDVSTGYAYDETYFTMSYTQDGKEVATLEYGEYEGKPNVKMIEVDPEYRRKGIATKLLQELQRKYPDTEINFGMTTPDGSKLLESITYDVTDEAVVADRQKLKDLQAELDDLQEKLDVLYDTDPLTEEQRSELEKLGDRWQEVYEAIHYLSEDLRGKRATRTFVKTDAKYSLGEVTEAQNEQGLSRENEVQYSLSKDTEFSDRAIAKNNASLMVDQRALTEAKVLREKIAARMNEIKDRGLVGLPDDIEGPTFIANSSYDGTEENTTICPRSLASEAFVDAVSEYLGRPLSVEEQIYISQDLQGRSMTPECTYCYVATDRKAYRAFLGDYIKQRDFVLQKVQENPDADVSRSGELYKEFLNGRKDTNPMFKRFKMWVDAYKNGKPMVDASHLANINKLMGDINSEFGAELKPQIVDAMKYAQSASWAKKRVNYVAYDGHILKWKQDRINKLNAHYGLRMYSFSDFHPAFVLENMQMITDASVRGLKMLGYTKDTDFVDIFAPSGMNINVSTFGFESGGNVYENNLIGAEWEKAKALREQYPNVGITFVATNDTLVNWALDQDWIDVVIPYHLVRTGAEVAKAFGYTNYTSESADTKTKEWAKGKDQKYIAPTKHNNDKATYLAALEKNHLKPRFERFIDNPNYMKLVNECRRPASESKPVQPVFNEDAAMVALAKLEANGYYQPIGGSVDRMYEIAAEVAENMTKQVAPTYSLSEDTGNANSEYAPTFYSHMAKVVDGVKQNKLGAASVVNMLRGKGVKAEEIKWSGIEEWLEGKKSVTKAELQEFVQGSQLNIEEQERGKPQYTDEEHETLRVVEEDLYNLTDRVADRWETVFGTEMPLEAMADGETLYGSIKKAIRKARPHPDRYSIVEDPDRYEEYQKAFNDLQRTLSSIREVEEIRDDIVAKAEERSKAKWEEYKLGGGENYREILFSVPGSSFTNRAMQAHWGEESKGVLAHARVQDFDTAEGKMLFIEEIQSDWHNQGQKYGYRKPNEKTVAQLQRDSNKAYEEFYQTVESMVYDNASWEDDDAPYYAHPVVIAEMFEGDESYFDQYKFTEEQKESVRAMVAEETARKEAMKTAAKDGSVPDAPFRGNYQEYVLKRLIREAVEKGYDSIGWTTADIQSERWSEEYAEGYRIEYDQDIPKFLNKYGKKWGAKVGKTDIQTKQLSQKQEADLLFMADILEDGEDYIRSEKGVKEVWTMPITPAMKQSVLYEGQPMYSLSEQGDAPYGNRGTLGKDIALAPIVENSTVQEETQLVEENSILPDDLAPMAEEEANAQQSENLASIDDSDLPPEVEAPYYGEEDLPTEPSDPFESKDIKAVGKRNVKAYMYENPEVKPFFQAEANVMLGELRNTIKGGRIYNDALYDQSGGERGWDGVKRETSDDIAYLRDTLGYSYAEIEKGLKAIIEDNGKENIAVAKRIEFVLNDRLFKGYNEFRTGMDIPPDQDYINLVSEKRISEYSEEAFASLLENAEDLAPAEDIAPVKPLQKATPDTQKAPIYESNDKGAAKGQTTMFEPPKPNPSVATVLTEEAAIAKEKPGIWNKMMAALVDKGKVFEDLSLERGNHEIQAKWNYALPSNTEARAQYFMENGANGVKSLKDIKKTVDKSGKAEDFFNYLYHVHNIDRMTLDQRFGVENKTVFGETITADVSRRESAILERMNPEFKSWAEDVYAYNRQLRRMLVEGNIISQKTADLWEKMYPHYVPIRRVDSKGQNISVPLDTNKTGVNNPIKRATGGSSDIQPVFETMAQRTEQTYRAIARNSFGIELKNALGTTINNQANNMDVDETVDTLVAQEDHLLKPGAWNSNPTFTVFENGERVEFEITEDMFDALKPAGKILGHRSKGINAVGNVRRNLLTTWNPVFALYRNPIKDLQDVAINSQHAVKTYMNIPNAIFQMATDGKYATEYHRSGGKSNTYFDSKTNQFKAEDNIFKKAIGMPVRAVEAAGEFIEEIPRLAEYIASRKEGRSVERSMLDAARVTTNFAAGGDFTKFLNSHGFTFLNASVQGASQHVRNFREAKQEGLKGYVKVLAKYTVAGLPTILLNSMIWDDDEEYEELSDYVKQNYYVVAKTEDGKFVRIPKGRTAAVMGECMNQMQNLVTGDDEVDFSTFFELFMNNIAPNNPLENNILAPIGQAITNTAWYGGDLVPSRLQDIPAEEQYDESTDSISKWLGEKTGLSPYKINYLLDQYSGGLGDVFLPMLTPEAESGDNSLMGNIMAPWKKEITTDKVLNNKNPGNFYDLKDELQIQANSRNATDEDRMKVEYMNAVGWDMSDLYKQKRDIQNRNLPDDVKYEEVRKIQDQINELAKNALEGYNNVHINGLYSEVGDRRFNYDEEKGKWYEISEGYYYEQEQKVTKALGISYDQYWNNREEYDYAYDKPEQYALSQAVGGYQSYRSYTSELWDIKADKDENGKSISGSRKDKVIDYINNLDADYGEKIILFKNEYNADDTYNEDIIDYLNGRDDISYEQMETILKYLGFEVDSEGNISWD